MKRIVVCDDNTESTAYLRNLLDEYFSYRKVKCEVAYYKSGAGKSTLLHIIGCIDTFESGTYTIDETNVHKLSDKQLANIRNEKVGIVMQDFALVEEYTVLENVRIPLYFSHSKKSDIPKALALSALKRVGI